MASSIELVNAAEQIAGVLVQRLNELGDNRLVCSGKVTHVSPSPATIRLVDCAIFSSRRGPNVLAMSTQIKTWRSRRTWIERLRWKRAYETKIFDECLEALGRGPTPEASLAAAEWRWVEEHQREYEANRERDNDGP